jgi:hypothetical protein
MSRALPLVCVRVLYAFTRQIHGLTTVQEPSFGVFRRRVRVEAALADWDVMYAPEVALARAPLGLSPTKWQRRCGLRSCSCERGARQSQYGCDKYRSRSEHYLPPLDHAAMLNPAKKRTLVAWPIRRENAKFVLSRRPVVACPIPGKPAHVNP